MSFYDKSDNLYMEYDGKERLVKFIGIQIRVKLWGIEEPVKLLASNLPHAAEVMKEYIKYGKNKK